jgi:hypothetical protein
LTTEIKAKHIPKFWKESGLLAEIGINQQKLAFLTNKCLGLNQIKTGG